MTNEEKTNRINALHLLIGDGKYTAENYKEINRLIESELISVLKLRTQENVYCNVVEHIKRYIEINKYECPFDFHTLQLIIDKNNVRTELQ